MRIIFAGASELGLKCCETLLETGHEVVGILTIPERFTISYAPQGVTNVLHASFADLAAAHAIPVFPVTSGKTTPKLAAFLDSHPADLMVVAGWYYMVGRSVRARFPKGTLGIHNSLLPHFRGGAPLPWAMISGVPETGTSLFFLEDGVDTGHLLDQRRFSIEETDEIADLLKKAETAALAMVRETLPRYERGEVVPYEQVPGMTPEEYEQRYPIWRQRSPQDGLIDWGQADAYIDRFIRAQSHPYPGAFFRLGDLIVKVWQAERNSRWLRCGTLTFHDNVLLVGTGSGTLSLDDVTLVQDVTETTGLSHGETLECLRNLVNSESKSAILW